MVSSWRNRRSPIDYPSLRTLLHGGAECIETHARSIELLVHEVFGGNHHLLSVEQRWLRLDLWKFVNLLRQMDALEDVEVFELGFRCPEQVKSYERSLETLIEMAERRDLDPERMKSARLAHARVWHVRKAVTQFSEGLS